MTQFRPNSGLCVCETVSMCAFRWCCFVPPSNFGLFCSESTQKQVQSFYAFFKPSFFLAIWWNTNVSFFAPTCYRFSHSLLHKQTHMHTNTCMILEKKTRSNLSAWSTRRLIEGPIDVKEMSVCLLGRPEDGVKWSSIVNEHVFVGGGQMTRRSFCLLNLVFEFDNVLFLYRT